MWRGKPGGTGRHADSSPPPRTARCPLRRPARARRTRGGSMGGSRCCILWEATAGCGVGGWGGLSARMRCPRYLWALRSVAFFGALQRQMSTHVGFGSSTRLCHPCLPHACSSLSSKVRAHYVGLFGAVVTARRRDLSKVSESHLYHPSGDPVKQAVGFNKKAPVTHQLITCSPKLLRLGSNFRLR